MTHAYEYPHPGLAVDCVVFGLDERDLKILLIRRGLEPYEDRWALPGGFVGIDESLEDAARRDLYQETGLKNVFLEQLYTFGAVDRDPRERVVTVAYYALVKLSEHRPAANTGVREAAWFAIDDRPPLAFDHDDIARMAHERLRSKVRYQPLGFELLPRKFPLRMLQHLYETILDRPLDKRNFRKKMLSMGVLEELDEIETDVAHRAARLYRFDRKKYERLTRRGFNFEV